MPVSLLPKYLTDSVTDLTPQFLTQRRIRLLMLDFDNTLVPYTRDVPTQEIRDWLEGMKRSDIQVCIVSNSHRQRVPDFCREYGLDCITYARKPFPKGIRQCLERYRIPASQAALVGDQIYTDTLGANGTGVTPILVRAIDNHTFWLKARHVLELPFIFAARNRRIDK